MEALDDTVEPIGGPYVEEIFLEAYNLQWKCIDLRCKRLQKMRQHVLLTHQMELEEARYKRQLRRLKQKKEARQQEETRRRLEEETRRRQQEETRRRQEEEARRRYEEEARRRQWEKERAEMEKQKKQEKKAVQMDEDVALQRKKATTKMKSKMIKTKMQPKQVKKIKPKRIVPIAVPSIRLEDEAGTDENENEGDGHESSPSELPDDGLLDLLSLDKASDSDIDDEPSMVSLILPAAQDSPKLLPVEKKKSTPQKRFVNKRGGVPVDFDFTNAEAKRQAKAAEAAEAARNEQYGSDEDDAEPEPMPVPSVPIPKKRLKRRKEAAKGRQRANGVNASGEKTLMTAMANTTIAIKPKKGVTSDEAATRTNGMRKKVTENGTVPKGPLGKTKSKNTQLDAEAEGRTPGVSSTKTTTNGKTETMSIKQRLANVELLAQMIKMQDMNTPKVLGKKTRKTQKQEAKKTLAAKRAEMRNMLSSGTEEADALQPDQMIEEGDLNISLNSSGLLSDNDSPENYRAPTRKRPRAAVQGDVTPKKKLQFLEITKRLAKSPMPRFLRTPTPLTSPVGVSSARVNPKAASPAPRAASARNTAPNDYEERRMNSAPVWPKKTTNANRFGVPIGGANVSAGGGSFSMFDAFVNSGSGIAIPRLRKKA